MAFKMKGFHLPGIAGVQAERDKMNELSGKTQKVMKVKSKNDFSTIASRNKIYNDTYGETLDDETYVAPGATLGDKKRGDAHELESKKTSGFPKNGDPKTKTMTAKVASVMPDGGGLMVETPNGIRKVSGGAQGIAEIKEGQTVTLNVGGGGKLTLDAKKADDDLTGGPLKKATHTMPDGTVMPGAKHRQ